MSGERGGLLGLDGTWLGTSIRKLKNHFSSERRAATRNLIGGEDRLVQRRSAPIEEMRGFLLERGTTFLATSPILRKNLCTLIGEAEQNLSRRLRSLLERLWQEWKQPDI